MPLRRLRCLIFALFAAFELLAQTTNGVISGTITDPSGSTVGGVEVEVTNPDTGLRRSAMSGDGGAYTVPQLPPGLYNIEIKKTGFATETRRGVQLLVNQNAAVDFKLSVSSVTENVEVTAAPPALNTSSATLGDVVQHQQIVNLPLNGRNFTQLTLLTPGAAPQEAGQQSGFTVKQGAGAISPSVNGQRGQQNNFTMDGVLNNAVYTNTWAISPPPDALQEFNVQSHITDSQFSISSGANINIVSGSGTNDFHGAVWEFLRNDKLDARNFFDPVKPPYRQNQYGLVFSGPVLFPKFNGKNNTWFSAYWEGFRSRQSLSSFASVPTAAMRQGDFSGLQNQIFDPATSRADPTNPANIIRDPFPGNIIPTPRLNGATQQLLQRYYPLPNLGVGENVLPNYQFIGSNSTDTDQTGIRVDHRFGDKDTVFGRYNRTNATLSRPESLPTYQQSLVNYAQTVAVGWTHIFGPRVILNLHYGYTNTNFGQFDEAAGEGFLQSTNFGQIAPVKNGLALGPQVGISNGYTGVSQFAIPLGPQQNHDGHVDLSVVRGNHTLGVGAMIYHIHSFDDGYGVGVNFAQNATAQGGLANNTGSGAASFLLGLPDNLGGFLGETSADLSTYWYAGYVQDQWQASKNLTVTIGLRYDVAQPPTYTKTVSGLDIDTGNYLISAPYPPLFPQANARKSYFDPHYNGLQPRFGVAYRASEKTVFRSAFAIFDDHNNTLVQEGQDLRISWPTGVGVSLNNLNRGQPTTFLDNLPPYASFFNPLQPYIDFGASPRNKIPYVMEYNAGVQQQIGQSFVLNLDYVGSVGRHQFIQPTANTALTPGPGSLASRGQPFPAYGGNFSYDLNVGTSSYNALQVKLQKSLSMGLNFLASYTWSKSMDIQSEGQSGSISTIYDLRRDWAPSDYNRTHLFTWSGTYELPFGKGKRFLSGSRGLTNLLLGGWNLGGIVTLTSGQPFSVTAGGDLANVGGGTQRAQVVGDPSSGYKQSIGEWFNTAAFAVPAPFTFGNEGRNNLVGPPVKNFDVITYKDFSLTERFRLQFRSEFFNIANHANFGLPSGNAQDAAFGRITATNSSTLPRQIQFALKLLF